MKNWIKEHCVFSGIAGAILAAVVAIIITIMSGKKEDKQGVSISGNFVVSGDTAITGSGNINIIREESLTSDRIITIQKRLKKIQSNDPHINYLIQQAKKAFYSNNIDEAEKIIKKIDFKQRTNQ